MRLILLAFAVLALTACEVKTTATAEKARPDFRAALDAHLSAIQARDLEGFAATLTNSEELYTIFPDGGAITTPAQAKALHEEWFKDGDWRWDGEVMQIMEGADMAAALMKYDYRDAPDGEPRSAWLTLIFKLEGGEWRLVHDQNTRIEPQTELTENESD
jgi:ketosteroid isomerase-like protein